MVRGEAAQASDLPTPVNQVLTDFAAAAHDAFGPDLRSIILYGSAAEGRLRATSDVNVLLLLSAFDQAKADHLREPLRVAQAAIRLTAMFLLESEIESAITAFAEKFSDILRRRRILYGPDPFAGMSIPRAISLARLRQVLLNLTLRLRESYVARGLREEQLALIVADAAGPLRSCAATLLELEGQPASAPKEALEQVAGSLPEPAWRDVLSRLSEAREKRFLPPGVSGPTLLQLIELTQRMRSRAGKIV